MEISKNNVPASEQIKEKTKIFNVGGKINVLFIGNSITLHEPKSELGWFGEWGMAASKKENDYVHRVLAFLNAKYGKVNYCITNVSHWESDYKNDDIIPLYEDSKNFNADIIIYRFGENSWQARDEFAKNPLEEHYDKFVKYFLTENTKKVVLTSLFWEEKTIDKALLYVAEKNGFDYVNINDLGSRDDCKALKEFAHSGVAMHPGDYGMKLIAERITEKL